MLKTITNVTYVIKGAKILSLYNAQIDLRYRALNIEVNGIYSSAASVVKPKFLELCKINCQ